MFFTYVILAIVLIAIVYVVYLYNNLITLKNRIDNAWSQIDVQLKRRHDLIPNLVSTVQGYAKHEKSTFEMVTKARTQLMSASTVSDKAKADNMLTGALKSLFAVSEAYPELKANQNFLALQEELSSTESKIAFSRQFYNDNVMDYNTKIQMLPSSILASMMNLQKKDYFSIDDASEKVAPKVTF